MDRRSPHRRSSLRRERSPAHPRSSPSIRSPRRTSSSHRVRSPMKERLHDRSRSPKQLRASSPPRTSLSRSPSPRTKRLMQARYEKETDRLPEKGHERHASREERDEGRRRAQYEKVPKRLPEKGSERNSSREERNEGRQKDHGEGRDARNERRSAREVNDSGPSRSSRHARTSSPEERGHRSRYNSRSPPDASKTGGREEATKSRQTEESWDGDHDSVAKMKAAEEALENKEKQKPSFELSGKLAEETNRVRGVTLLFNEPPDARKPDTRWRLYVFKAGEVLNEPLYVHRQTCYLFGRERRVADIPTDHPSCSKQHAVLQFRLVEKEQPDGLLSEQVRPYLMDLGSTNGSFVNDNRIEPQRYYELFEKDTIRFGNSSREYVLLHEHSAG